MSSMSTCGVWGGTGREGTGDGMRVASSCVGPISRTRLPDFRVGDVLLRAIWSATGHSKVH
jgi:hypothetical protein